LSWVGDGSGEGWEVGTPGSLDPDELEVVVGATPSNGTRGSLITESPEGDDTDELDGSADTGGVGSDGGDTRAVVGTGASTGGGRVAGAAGCAHPFLVPDLGLGKWSASGSRGWDTRGDGAATDTFVTDGTEGFTPLGSVGEELSGEGSPSTGTLSGIKRVPPGTGGWLRATSSVGGEACPGLSSFWGLLKEARVGWWLPWAAWKWWDSWGLWWSEEGGEGVHLGVLVEESDVGIPSGLGGVVGGDSAAVGGADGGSVGTGSNGDGSWDVSHLSEVEVVLGAADLDVTVAGSSGDSGVGSAAGSGGAAVEGGNVTVDLSGNSIESGTVFGIVVGSGLVKPPGWGVPGSAGSDTGSWSWTVVGVGDGGGLALGGGLTVPGSEAGELSGWHVEEWETLEGSAGDIEGGSGGGALLAEGTNVGGPGGGSVELHAVDNVGLDAETLWSAALADIHVEAWGGSVGTGDPGTFVGGWGEGGALGNGVAPDYTRRSVEVLEHGARGGGWSGSGVGLGGTADGGPLWATDESELSSWVLVWGHWLDGIAVCIGGTNSVVETVTAPPGGSGSTSGVEGDLELTGSKGSICSER